MGIWVSTQDVIVQDPHSIIVDAFISQKLNSVTLAQTVIEGSSSLIVEAGHNIVAGDYLEIWEDPFILFQAEVLNVNVNTITLALPLPHPYTVGATVNRVNVNMNVDGSVTPVEFTFAPQGKYLAYDITQIKLRIVNTTAGGDTTFGDIGGGLTKGLYATFIKNGDTINNFFNIKTNGDFQLLENSLGYGDKFGGYYSEFWTRHFAGQHNMGVAIRVSAYYQEVLKIIIRDNLSTLISFKMLVQGHQVV